MGKVTKNSNLHNIMAKSPTFEKNHNKENYYIASMQEKVNEDFIYRFNAFDIEEETKSGTLDFDKTFEAAVTTALTDKGKKLSEDWKKLTFRDINHYVQVGKRYRFSADPENVPPSIWMATNLATTAPVSNCIIRKCNNSLGMMVDNNTRIHYEPCIVEPNMQYVNLYYNNDVVIAQATLYVILQHNEYTHNIMIDDRFIIGYNQVFKVKSVNNFLNVTTMDDNSAPTILLSLDKDTIKATDDFTLKITEVDKYNPHEQQVDNYSLHFDYNEDKVFIGEQKEYTCRLYENNIEIPYSVTYSIKNVGEVPAGTYDFIISSDSSFTILNKKMYNKAPLIIEASVSIGEQILTDTIEIWLGGLF